MKKVKRVQKKDNRKVKNAVSLEQNGLIFKSKLEHFTYNKLLENDIDNFDYEKVKFTLLKGFEYNANSFEMYEKSKDGVKSKYFDVISNSIRPITYLPDFTCVHEDKTGWIIEVKGYANESFPNKWKYFKEWLVINGYNVTLYKPNNRQNVLKTIELIKQKYYN